MRHFPCPDGVSLMKVPLYALVCPSLQMKVKDPVKSGHFLNSFICDAPYKITLKANGPEALFGGIFRCTVNSTFLLLKFWRLPVEGQLY